MSEEQRIPVYKFTLPNKMEITLREPKISDTSRATQVAGKKAGTNQAHLNILIQEEVVKLLLVSVNGKVLKNSEKESLDTLFTLKEYGNVLKAVNMISGGGR